MPSRPAARQKPQSDVGSPTTMPIGPLGLRQQDARRGLYYAGKRGEIGGLIEPRIHLSQAAILSRISGPPVSPGQESQPTMRSLKPITQLIPRSRSRRSTPSRDSFELFSGTTCWKVRTSVFVTPSIAVYPFLAPH